MIIYVAGPMSGITQYNYPAFHDAAGRLLQKGWEVRNPAAIDALFPPACGHDQMARVAFCDDCDMRDWRWYMRKALVMLLEADGIALLDGWQHSKGATLEVTVATSLRLPIHTLDDWLVMLRKASN